MGEGGRRMGKEKEEKHNREEGGRGDTKEREGWKGEGREWKQRGVERNEIRCRTKQHYTAPSSVLTRSTEHSGPSLPAAAVTGVVALVLPRARAGHLLLVATRRAFAGGGLGGGGVVGVPCRAPWLGQV